MTDLDIPPPPNPWRTAMTPLPDDFNPAAHAAAYGSPATDRAEDQAAIRDAATREANRKAAAILNRAFAEIVALGNFEWNARGYDLVDALEVLGDLTPKVT